MRKENDFVKELGYLGFTMRLKRISDAMMHEGRRLYDYLDVDIEPNWYVVFKLLKVRGAMSVMEISDAIMMAHPSVISIINKMTKSGYLISQRDENDSRRRVIDLSEKARKKLPDYEQIWLAGELGVEKALDGMNALDFIAKMEEKFFKKGFKERTLSELDNKI